MKKPIEVPVGYKVYRDDTGWVCEHDSGTEVHASTLGQALRKCIIKVTRYQLAEDGIY